MVAMIIVVDLGSSSGNPLAAGIPARSRVPECARRENRGEGANRADRDERPDEEEASRGRGDRAVSRPLHVKNWHGRCKEPADEHDDVPESPFGERERSDEPDEEDDDSTHVTGPGGRYAAC